MLELLLPPATSQQPSEGLSFPSEAPMMTAFIGLAAADVQGTPEAAAKGESEIAAAAAAFDDADFDLLFGQQLPFTAAAASILDDDSGDDGILVGEGDLLQDLFQLADTECVPAMEEVPAAAAVDSPDDGGVSIEDDYSATAASSSPASFDDTTLMSLKSSPSSPAPSSFSSSSSSSSSSSRPAGVSTGRVTKKKEANREAAYRYRMKQRLGDTAMQERCAELQADADGLASRLEAAESEAKFLMQMCRQIFSSRKQLSVVPGLAGPRVV